MATTPTLYSAQFYTPNFSGGDYGIELEWDILVGETYEIQVSLDNTFTSFQSTTIEGFDTGGFNPTLLGLDQIGDAFVAATTYYFRINATDGGGTTAWSNILSASTADAYDSGGGGFTPTLYSAQFYTPNFSGGDYGVYLEWDIFDGETYEIQVSLDDTFTTTDSTTFTGFDTGGTNPNVIGLDQIGSTVFAADTTYYFRFNFNDGFATSDWSNTVSASTAAAVDAGGGSLSTRSAYEFEAFQSNLNRLAGLDGSYSAQYAANWWAGTVDEPLLNALNIVAGTQGLGLRAVANLLAGTDNLGVAEALRRIP